ncbi:MAG: hypothetical protein GDA41_12335 [Rhodospirillales bacterium]|nr:hypothetical protein [Rhodospirillales bacterium]
MRRPGETPFPRTAGDAVAGAIYGRLSPVAEACGAGSVPDRRLGTEGLRRKAKTAQTAGASAAVAREGGA